MNAAVREFPLQGQTRHCERGFVASRKRIIVVTDASAVMRLVELIENESPGTRIDMRSGFLMATVFVSM
ncbi:MAG TPA: hypothetical protein PK156_46605 [Polyangium sp.]|nr:hypothetical protein [Polyangium sp.]